MKVLLVAWYFPPTNTIAAVRLGGLAAFLRERGHEVRIIAAKGLPYRQTLPLDLPSNEVTYTRWADVNALPKAATTIVKRVLRPFSGSAGDTDVAQAGSARATADPGETGGQVKGRLSRFADALFLGYEQLVCWPDRQVGWMPFAVWAGIRLFRGWRPDLILASGPPFTTLVIGRLLSAWSRVPWVIEFRDRWADDPYYPPPPWRRRLLVAMERSLVRSALGVTTVSEPWAETYRRRYGKPTAVICNGFDREIDRVTPSCGTAAEGTPSGTLRIVYTGGIYVGRRDPTPLFQAIGLLGAKAAGVKVEFYGTDPAQVMPLAKRARVEDRVLVHPEVTHVESVAIQRGADALLLMQWDDPKEQGNVPGKFFEYLGARRPILVLGLEDGVPASIVRDREAGVFGGSPEAIAEQLSLWIDEKQRHGAIPAVPESGRAGYSRAEQYERLESFLGDLLGSGPERGSASSRFASEPAGNPVEPDR